MSAQLSTTSQPGRGPETRGPDYRRLARPIPKLSARRTLCVTQANRLRWKREPLWPAVMYDGAPSRCQPLLKTANDIDRSRERAQITSG